MFNLYLEPEDLVNLLAENVSLTEEQLHFHTNYYKGISSIYRIPESCIALSALSALTRNFSQSILELSKFNSSSSALLNYLHYFLSGLVHESIGDYELSLNMFKQALLFSNQTKLKKPFLIVICLFNALFLTENYQELANLNIEVHCLPQYVKQLVLVKLAFCYENLKNNEKAVESLDKALEFGGELGQVLKLWRYALVGMECCEDFERCIEDETDQNKKCDWILVYTIYLAKTGMYQKCKEWLEIRISTITSIIRPEIYSILSYSYFHQESFTHSFIYALKYLKVAPKSAIGWYNLAVLYKKSQQPHYQKCIKKFNELSKSSHNDLQVLNITEMILINFDISKFGQPLEKIVKVPTQIPTNQSSSILNDSNSLKSDSESIGSRSIDDEQKSEKNCKLRDFKCKLKTDIIGYEDEELVDFEKARKKVKRMRKFKKNSKTGLKRNICIPKKRKRKDRR